MRSEHPPGAQAPDDRPAVPARKRWIEPQLQQLPRLTDLTLSTTVGDPIGGGQSLFP
jgi:hypothetical protein